MNEPTDLAEIAQRLMALKVEHRDLDLAIERLARDPEIDQLQLTRMKKRKLRIKDMIGIYQSRLIPDLDA
ncbi:MAG: YdcH family protein [Lysobacterales bacterium]